MVDPNNPRHRNSDEEIRAFAAILSPEDRPRIPEPMFITRYLPILANIDGGGANIGFWLLEVDKTMNKEVDVIGSDGAVLFTVPPLLATYPTETKFHQSRSLAKISEIARHNSEVSPVASELYLEEILSKHFESIKDSPTGASVLKSVKEQWDAIFVRYGLPPRFSPLQPGEKTNSAPEFVVEGFDD